MSSYLTLITSFWFPILLPFVIVGVFISFLLTSLGKSIGFRKRYVQVLRNVFQLGLEEISEKKSHNVSESEEEQTPTLNPTSNGFTAAIPHESVQLSKDEIPLYTSLSTQKCEKKDFHLSFVVDFIIPGVEAIIDDEVTKRFAAEELPFWNLLTRTNRNYHYISPKLTVLWGVGFFLRYFIMLPIRTLILIFGLGWLVVCTAAVGSIPDGKFKRTANWYVSMMCFRILSRVFSAIVTYHNRENKAKRGGICVANHTSPIDVVILASDNCYALIGQSHGGLLGIIQRALSRAASHIWFERGEEKDRELVAKRLRQHIEDPNKLPILIFPEGTCINNTSVMMFKKGSFEIGGCIYPVAIKYDPRFGDPFWDSSRYGYVHYLFRMMSSWAIVCDVWYMPPMTIQENENAIEFANRVKAEIARQGGLVDLMWDGQLKRMQVKKEWKEIQQKEFSKRIKLE